MQRSRAESWQVDLSILFSNFFTMKLFCRLVLYFFFSLFFVLIIQKKRLRRSLTFFKGRLKKRAHNAGKILRFESVS